MLADEIKKYIGEKNLIFKDGKIVKGTPSFGQTFICEKDMPDINAHNGGIYIVDDVEYDKNGDVAFITTINDIGYKIKMDACKFNSAFRLLNNDEVQKALAVDMPINNSTQKECDNFHKHLFNIGDWVTNGSLTLKVEDIDEESKTYRLNNGTTEPIDAFDKKHDFWTIDEARNGDVLIAKGEEGSEHGDIVFVFKELSQKRVYVGGRTVEYYCANFNDGFRLAGNGFMGVAEGNKYEPADKEVAEKMYGTIRHKGYILDKEKKRIIEAKEVFHPGDFLFKIDSEFDSDGKKVFIYDGVINADGYGVLMGFTSEGDLCKTTGKNNYQYDGDVRKATQEEVNAFIKELYLWSKPINDY